MSEHLSHAMNWLTRAENAEWTEQKVWNLIQSLSFALNHLESAPEVQPHRHRVYDLSPSSLPIPEPREETPQSETPSSVATETDTATNVTLPISWMWSSRVSLLGKLEPSPLGAISDWLNSLWILGIGQEVEILLTLTSKGSTPPGGSHSPSTEARVQGVNGHAGDQAWQCAVEDIDFQRCELKAGHSGLHEIRINNEQVSTWAADPPPESQNQAGQ
jgi:hypothetical protein